MLVLERVLLFCFCRNISDIKMCNVLPGLVLEIMPEGNLASANRRIGSCGWDASSIFDLSGNKLNFLCTKGAEGVDDGSLQWLGNQEDPCTDLKAPLLSFLSASPGKEVVLGAGVLRQDHAGAHENSPSEEEAAILRQIRRVMWRCKSCCVLRLGAAR